MITVDEKKIKNCKIVSIRYKILKSNFQELRYLMYTLVKIESGKNYKLSIIHKRENGISDIYNKDYKILRSLITSMN